MTRPGLHRLSGELALLACAITWGATFPLVRLALRDASPLALNAVRFTLAALVLLPWLAPSVFRSSPSAIRRGLVLGTVLAVGFAAQSAGMLTISAGRSAFLTTSYVLITPLVAFIALRHRPRAAVVGGAALALLGIALMTGTFRGAEGPGFGDLLTLAGAVLFALQIILLDVAMRSGDRVRSVLLLQLVACALLSAAAAPLVETPRFALSPRLAASVAFLSIVASAGALALQAHGQRRVEPSRAALIVASEPVWAALIALPFGETMTGVEVAGAILVFSGVICGSVRAAPAQETSSTPR